jgi:WD40 repeat protein
MIIRQFFFFDISSNVPLWSYVAEGGITAVAISSDGNYFTVGSTDNQVYLFRWTPTIAIDEDDNKLDIDFGENTIPFGNYYLPITLISVLVLILIKRKKLSSKNKI